MKGDFIVLTKSEFKEMQKADPDFFEKVKENEYRIKSDCPLKGMKILINKPLNTIGKVGKR